MIRNKTFKSLSLALLLFGFLGTLSLNSCREQKKKEDTEEHMMDAEDGHMEEGEHMDDEAPAAGEHPTGEHPNAGEHPTQDADTTAGEHPNSGEHPSGN